MLILLICCNILYPLTDRDWETINKMMKDKVLYLQENTLGKLDVHDSVKKKRLCIGIAKFYIKILHVFSAIVATMNPVYSYKNDMGVVEKVPYMKKNSIPAQYKDKVSVTKLGLCHRRINALMTKIIDETRS